MEIYQNFKDIENCKKYGMAKFVIICNNQIMEIKVNELT
jgi:hypothetical protein